MDKSVFKKANTLIIFGAGAVGEQILNTCIANEISIACFCDNHENKRGTFLNEIPILPLEEVKKVYESPTFIISPLNEIHQKNIALQLEKNGFSSHHSAKYFFDTFGVFDSTHVLQKSQVNRLKMREYETISSDITYIESIDFIITEKCSLNCRDCSSLMPYYENPMHCNKEELFSSIDRIDAVFDVVGELRILGGEPLLNQDWVDIVLYAQKKSTIECIKIYTNATILPKSEKLKQLDKEKVAFFISNYPNLSNQLVPIRQLLDQEGISYVQNDMDEWIECSKIKDYQRTKKELSQVYTGCLAKICRTVSNGKLFNCPFLANAERLQALPSSHIEFVDLFDTTKTIAVLQQELKHYIYGLPHLLACNYCSSRNLNATEVIPVAVQTKSTLPYKKYDKRGDSSAT